MNAREQRAKAREREWRQHRPQRQRRKVFEALVKWRNGTDRKVPAHVVIFELPYEHDLRWEAFSTHEEARAFADTIRQAVVEVLRW